MIDNDLDFRARHQRQPTLAQVVRAQAETPKLVKTPMKNRKKVCEVYVDTERTYQGRCKADGCKGRSTTICKICRTDPRSPKEVLFCDTERGSKWICRGFAQHVLDEHPN